MAKEKKQSPKWTRTTILIREDHLDKFKVLAWWEDTTLKALFDEMIESYLSSKDHVDQILEKRKKKNVKSAAKSS
jgi:hypothetical protein